MADYSTTVKVKGDVSDLVAKLRQAEQAVSKLQSAMSRSSSGGGGGMADAADRAAKSQRKVGEEAARTATTVETSARRQRTAMEGVGSSGARAERAHRRIGQSAVDAAGMVENATRRQKRAVQDYSTGLGKGFTQVERAGTAAGKAINTSTVQIEAGAARQAAAFTSSGAAITKSSAGLNTIGGAAAKAEQGTSRAANAMQRASRSMSDFGRSAAMSMGAMVAVGGIAKLATSFLEFDASMSAVQANTHATGAELSSLREAAIQAGAATKFSATDAANGINELGKAGVQTKDILGGGLTGALDLAAAGQMDVAEAAEVSASAMTQFGLSGQAVPRIADMLSNAANNAQGSVHDMGMALNQTGLVAHGMGMSMQDTVTALTLFAKAGMTGSDAGTSLKTMIQRLQNPTDQARAAMADLGLQVYDTNGAFVGMRSVFDQLKTKTAGYSQEQRDAALATIFGADAVRGANAAIQAGASGWDQAAAAVTRWGGAAQQAAALNDNLKGDLEQLGGSLETLFIKGGGLSDGLFRPIVQGATGLVNALSQVPAPVMGSVAALTAMSMLGPRIGTAMTGATNGVRSFLTSVADNRAAILAKSLNETGSAAGRAVGPLTSLGATARGIGGALGGLKGIASGLVSALGGPWGIALAAAGTALAVFGQRAAEQKAKVQELTSAYQADGNAVGDYTKKAMATQAVQDGVASAAQRAGLSMTDFAKAVTGTGEAYSAYRTSLDGMIGAHMDADGALDSTGRALTSVYDAAAQARQRFWEMKEAGASTADAMAAFGVSADQAGEAAGKIGSGASQAGAGLSVVNGQVQASGQAAADAASKFDSLVQSIAGLGSVLGGQREAARGFQAAIDGASEAVKANGRNLDITTEKGRANQKSLDDIATTTSNWAAKSLQAGESAAAVAQHVQAGRSAFIAAAIDMGMHADKAKALADSMGLIPSNVTTAVQTSGLDVAGGQIDALTGKLTGVDGMTATASVDANTAAANESIRNFMVGTAGQKATMIADADIHPGVTSLETLQAHAAGLTATMNVGADIHLGVTSLEALQAQASGTTATMFLGVNPASAYGTLSATVGAMNGAQGTALLGMNAAPANATIGSTVARGNGAKATGTLGMNNAPATAKISSTVAKGNGAKATMKLDGNNSGANGKINASVAKGNGSRATIKVGADTGAANAAIAAAARARTAIIHVVAQVSSALTGGFFGHAQGGAAKSRMPRGYKTGGATRDDELQVFPDGGAVRGPGTGTSDSVLTLLPSGFVRTSNREHILTAREVQMAGGQDAIYALRSMIRGGWRVPGYSEGGVPGYASGGAVSRALSGFSVVGRDDILKAQDAWQQAADSQRSAAKANYEATKALQKAKKGTQAFAEALADSKSALWKYQQANRDAGSARAALNQAGAAAKLGTAGTFLSRVRGQNAVSSRFLADIETIARRGFPDIARELLEAGEDQAGPIAAQTARLTRRSLFAMSAQMTRSANNEAWRGRLTTALTPKPTPNVLREWATDRGKANAGSRTFLNNIARLQARGFGNLALQLLNDGEERSGAFAAQAVKQGDRYLHGLTGSLVNTQRLDAQRDARLKALQDATALSSWSNDKRSTLAGSATFTANLRKLAQRGFGKLALAMLNEGEDKAGPAAAQAVRQGDRYLWSLQGTVNAITAGQTSREDLAAELAGKGVKKKTTDPVVMIKASELARAAKIAAATAVAGPSPYGAGRAVPVSALPYTQPAAAGQHLVGIESLTINESRSPVATAQQINRQLSWAWGAK